MIRCLVLIVGPPIHLNSSAWAKNWYDTQPWSSPLGRFGLDRLIFGRDDQREQMKKPQCENPITSKSPPRAEEETVKEVLSETPKRVSETFKVSNNGEDPRDLKTLQKKPTYDGPTKEKPSSDRPTSENKSPEVLSATTTPEDISELSEISESLSATVSEKREYHFRQGGNDNGEVRKGYSGSPARLCRNADLAVKRESISGKSPARKPNPSPRRRTESTPSSGVGRDSGHGLMRRGLGEKSGRRSRSPANRNETSGGSRSSLGRSPSVRKTAPSPGRVSLIQPEGGRKTEEIGKEKENRWSTTPNESLENPLVSLECFIFL
ncbi:hypothetical protein Nepgr_007254 [Nepenthes gracilis]|uniref:Uncharacterized protein n=1 Tax=Nepenthes gracilis TaxID=150966 RepID=A0AAD3XI72_NEPGR|nr:hypothetical protein Nepgr_007254 [Nepenthes gracilis]